MLVQDVVTIWVLSVLGGSALLFSLVFSSGWWSRRVDGFIRRSGDDINWFHVNGLGFSYGEQWKAYGVSEFGEGLSVFGRHRHVRKALVAVMREYNVSGSVEEFSMFVLTVRGGSVRFDDYVYEPWHASRVKSYKSLSLDELGRLAGLGFSSDVVVELARSGLGFDEIVASDGMPVEWALRVFAESSTV